MQPNPCNDTCLTCKRQLSCSKQCICKSCLNRTDGAFEDLISRVKYLRSESLRLQAQCPFKMQAKDEEQKLQLSTLRRKIQDTRMKTIKVNRRLRSLNTRYNPSEFNASFGLARDSLTNSINKMSIFLNAKKERHTAQCAQLNSTLDIITAEKDMLQRWTLEDIKLILQANSRLSDQLRCFQSIGESQEDVLQCVSAANQRNLRYYFDAFGQVGLILGALAAALQLPLRHRFRYQGPRSIIWLPKSFLETDCDNRDEAHPLHLDSAHSESGKKKFSQALSLLERSVAVCLCSAPHIVQSRRGTTLVANPLSWLDATLAECCTTGSTATHATRAFCPSQTSSIDSVTLLKSNATKEMEKKENDGKKGSDITIGPGNNKDDTCDVVNEQQQQHRQQHRRHDDEDWELIALVSEMEPAQVESSERYSNFHHLIETIRTVTNNYMGPRS